MLTFCDFLEHKVLQLAERDLEDDIELDDEQVEYQRKLNRATRDVMYLEVSKFFTPGHSHTSLIKFLFYHLFYLYCNFWFFKCSQIQTLNDTEILGYNRLCQQTSRYSGEGVSAVFVEYAYRCNGNYWIRYYLRRIQSIIF